MSLGVYGTLSYRSSRSTRHRGRIAIAGVAVLATAAVAIALAMSVEPIGKMLGMRATLVQEYDVVTEMGGDKSRFGIQVETLSLAMKHPVGIGAGQSESEHYQKQAPHNLFLHVLVEAGWAGGLAFYVFVGLTMWRSTRWIISRSEVTGFYQVAYASACGILVQNLFIDSPPWRKFSLILGILWGLTMAYERAHISVARSPRSVRPAVA